MVSKWPVKQQLKESKGKSKTLGEKKLELILKLTNSPAVKKIQKLIGSPEDWNGGIWENPDKNADEVEWDSNEINEPLAPLLERKLF